MQLEKEYALEFDPEELKRMSRILAQTLLEQVRSEDNEAQFTLITCVSGYEVIGEDQITEVVNLDLVASSTASVLDPLTQLKDWFTSIINSISSWIVSSIESFIDTYVTPTIDMISGNVSAIISDLANIPSLVVSAITQEFPALISDITDSVVSSIETVVLDPIRSFVDWVSAQFEALTPIADAIMAGLTDALNFIGSLSATLQNTFTSLIDQISSTLSSLSNSLTTVFSDLTTAVTATFDSLMSNLMSSINSITDTIMSSLSAIPSTISDLIDSITATFNSLISDLTDLVYSLSDTINASLSAIPDTIYSIIDSILADLTTTQGLINSIVASLSAIPETVESATAELAEVQKAISGFVDLLIDLPAKAPEIVYSIASAIWQQQIVPLFETINVTIIEPLKASVSDVVVNVSSGFQQITQVITGFTNSILHFPEWFPAWFEKYISKPITDAIIPIQDAITNPLSWITTSLQPIVKDATSSLWTGVQTVWNILLKSFEELSKALWEGLKGVSETIGDVLCNAFQDAWKMFKEVGEPFQEFVQEIYKQIPKGTISYLKALTLPVFKNIFEEFKVGTPVFLRIDYVSARLAVATEYMLGIGFMPLLGQLPIRLASWVLRALARGISGLSWKKRISLKPLGIGIETEFDLAKAFGASLSTYADNLMKWLDEVGRGIVYGYAIWMSQPIAKVLNFWFRNFIPIELPDEDIIIELARRSMQYTYERDATGKITKVEPSEYFSNVLNIARFYYGLYGYSDEALRWIFSYSLEDWVQTKDRFGYIRNFPISLMHELPSASDIATMMVRDLFFDFDSFRKVAHMRGMTEDIAYMYYFLRFRYPPPERLWQFVTRGISGLLWATLSTEELKDIEEEAKAVGAPVPISPAELNFKANELFNALKTYMKWHDYARFSWIKDFKFTSDNLIYIDTLADIPTKIDQRWLVKWGIYQKLADIGVTYKSPISDFVKIVTEGEPTDEIKKGVYLELDNFCRTLQSTGLHPYWVPAVAVAEAMNVLADERTLLRTGFLNLFKEGFWGVVALERLLDGFVKSYFGVTYFDTAQADWVRGYTEIPVRFLPAERKLLELRALMDRALDILRDTVRDLSRGYSEWIIENYEEFKEKLTSIINKINEFFAEDYKEITGVELPDELKLQFVEAYYKPYIASLDIWKDIYTIRRVRYWTQRWLGWIMYRVATGVVKKEDINEFAQYVGKQAKLTPYETKFIQGVLEKLMGIARREYIPTPSQLATLSEYMVIDETFIDKAFKAREIPKEWQNIWRSYIEIRPIADDIKSLLTTYRRALVYTTISEDLEKKILSYAQKINFTEEELEILRLRAQLEELILQTRQYLPTPSTLATLSEYVNLSADLIKQTLEQRGVPEEWMNAWLTYVKARPLKADAKSLLSAYIRALRYDATKKEEVDKFVTELPTYGFTTKEIEFITKRIELEEAIKQKIEYIPTPSQLATLAEYIVIEDELINKALKARRVPEEWGETWKHYIMVRPISDDVKGLLTAYRRALLYTKIPEEIEKEVLGYAELINFGTRELEILNLRVTLEKLIAEAREYIPTPSMLATLSEYLTIKEDLIKKVFDARNVPEEWRTIWRNYIEIRPIKSDFKSLITVARRALRYGAMTEKEWEKLLLEAYARGFTETEVGILRRIAELEEAIEIARENRREYIPTPSMLATLSEYLVISEDLIKKVFDARNVPEEWRSIWQNYITVRPIKPDFKSLITVARRALRYDAITEEEWKGILAEALKYGFTKTEIEILGRIAEFEESIETARENRREYIPTPSQLATICEYIPKAREFFDKVMEARHVPEEWRSIWADYVDFRPLVDEVKRMISRVEDLYVYFMITEEDFKKTLDQVKFLGYTEKEIEYMLTNARYERHYRAWRELIGDIDRMTMLAEYSPDARSFALGQLYKMIDALPIEEETKAVLKKMWEQFIRLKPVMDEVRRYVTELISDFVEGIITEEEFVSELKELKKWGLDDYEIMFYQSIAGMRKARYLRRKHRIAS